MAIVINGSGTVTGLAVGGLPDGTVDAGTLATDSVTAAKLEASAITVGDLPAGSVLQVVSSQAGSSSFSTTNSTVQSTGHSATITPSSTSSKIYVVVSFNGYQSTHGRTYKAYLYRASTQIGGLHLYEDGDSNPKTSSCITVLDSPSTTSAVTYEMKVGTDGSGTSYYNYSYSQGKDAITLMEIAG